MRRDRISAIVFVQAETNIAYIYSGWNNQNKIFVPQREKNYGIFPRNNYMLSHYRIFQLLKYTSVINIFQLLKYTSVINILLMFSSASCSDLCINLQNYIFMYKCMLNKNKILLTMEIDLHFYIEYWCLLEIFSILKV